MIFQSGAVQEPCAHLAFAFDFNDALRVSDGTREIGKVENKSGADFSGMAISVIDITDRPKKLRAFNHSMPYFGATHPFIRRRWKSGDLS